MMGAEMERTRLLGIFCNWSPFACLNAAGMAHFKMPPEYAFMRVMCIGRINQALILRAFEHGADGVILLECKDEDCRYGPGPEVGHSNVEKVRKLLHLLGIGQSTTGRAKLRGARKERTGPSLVGLFGAGASHGSQPGQSHSATGVRMNFDDPRIKGFIQDNALSMCLECGKCSSIVSSYAHRQGVLSPAFGAQIDRGTR